MVKNVKEGKQYVYHNNNDCYKWYTHKKKLQAIEEAELGACVDSDEQMNISKSDITQPMVHRSSVTPRDVASLELDSKLMVS